MLKRSRAVIWLSAFGAACKGAPTAVDTSAPPTVLPCPRAAADRECTSAPWVDGDVVLAGTFQPADVPFCLATESLESFCARYFDLGGVCPTLDDLPRLEREGWTVSVDFRWRRESYQMLKLHHGFIDQGDALPLGFFCDAIFEVETGALVSFHDDGRLDGFCCGTDGWAHRVVYGEPVPLECNEE